MIKKRLLGVLFAAVAMFIWGFIVWGVIGSVVRPMKTLPADKESAIVEVLTATETKTDVYHIPGMPPTNTGPEHEAWFEKHRRGPLAGIIFINEGKDPMATSMMVMGLLHMLITATALAWCLTLALDRLPSYGRRLGFVSVIGFITAFWVDAGAIIWTFHPLNNALFNAAYHFSGAFVAGLILAAFIKKPREITGHASI